MSVVPVVNGSSGRGSGWPASRAKSCAIERILAPIRRSSSLASNSTSLALSSSRLSTCGTGAR
jgi:hypothetical protein